MKKLTGLVALVAFGSGVVHAETTAPSAPVDRWDIYGSLGGAFEGRTGFELEVGVKFRPAPWIEFGASPANLVFYNNEDSQYQRQTFSNGQSRCRDLSNGQFARDELCGPDVAWRGTATAELNLGERFSVGGGYLFTDEGSAFGSLRYNLNTNFALQGRAGTDYGAIAVVLSF